MEPVEMYSVEALIIYIAIAKKALQFGNIKVHYNKAFLSLIFNYLLAAIKHIGNGNHVLSIVI